MISYQPLVKTLKQRQLSMTELARNLKLHPRTVTYIRDNDYMSLRTIDKICRYLDVPIEEVVEILRENR